MNSEPSLGRILFIGDDTNWLNLAQRILSEAGYIVESTQDVTGGWEVLRADQFGLVLVDLKKIDQDEKLFRNLTRLQAERGSRTVVISATELPPDKVAAIFNRGAQDCIDKQYDQSELLAFVQKQFADKSVTSIPADDSVEGQAAKKPITILIVEDEDDWRKRLERYLNLEPDQYIVKSTGDYSLAKQMLREDNFDVIVLDLRLIEDSDGFEGIELLKLLRGIGKIVAVVVVSAYGTVEHVKDGFMVYNICDYISKQNFDPDKYRQAIQRAAYQQRRERKGHVTAKTNKNAHS